MRLALFCPLLLGRDIAVSAKDATVRLAGRVQSWSQRLEAELLASEVLGARAVDNQLVAELETTRSDAEIQSEVEAALPRDAYLVGLPIDVAVLNGLVRLSGTVSSPYERTRAATRAGGGANARGVENLLQVEWWPDRSARVAAPEPRGDEDLARIVKDQLAQDDRIDARAIEVVSYALVLEIEGRLKRDWRTGPIAERINVDVEEGVVTLEGDVERFAERLAAERIAAQTPGVKRVRNRLSVDPYPYPWEDHPEGDEEPPRPWYWDFTDLPWIARNGD